jgi:hypothetical protein
MEVVSPAYLGAAATRCGMTGLVVMSTSKKAAGVAPWVTRKWCAVSTRPGMHWASRPVLPDWVWAYQSPVLQVTLRVTATSRRLEQL